ncbi:anhydro-N-acetylmuramic acid kinase [Clostridium tetanomorphum]|uniref:anhydro-N-acetylmuramic acid kinase AnmK n=1 Tax=Clostridium tetanomorphum TaxID=1553 RepID=UPI000449E0A6|nr:anhydro-N-acetylmuramic acid kinase AnmK [Clostridium tetanomorphum]KAJ49303.1 anhydro-N-acetylmuramic acid kinase [Clostridium tetanomorphum DSM 665]KAJ53066.1 anhydro-N-acetylmuramic acid kinase [Clostridium tetanomorphum DSM 665]MBP1865549.1 anhydro-N-acetylmuramic acid kinase [Clostridium tetanomorphum]NRS86495.1 anhydro-N-acetylmuramic acid kinase [Clostridium tetanomorphum]SQC00920.1 anhydro-N-acetylmuramic acid kinase [Clostridium tetanomorphum]
MSKYVVGVMSGTSLDGIDVALVKIDGYGQNSKVRLIKYIKEDMPKDVKKEIMNCCDINKSNVRDICSLNFKLGYIFADAIKKLCKEIDFPIEKVDLIGCHGQTIYHLANDNEKYIRSTLQIGEPAVIAYQTKTKVVSNFRTMDMAAGGQGAPLVPYTEYLIYRNSKSRLLQNIGGIGNVTVIPGNCTIEDVYAFDTGPGTMIIDEAVKQLKGMPYDRNGDIAFKGKINVDLLKELMNMDYVKKLPPKTTGREMFGEEFTYNLIKKWSHISDENFICTITAFTANSISEGYKKFIFPNVKIEEIIIGGGGSYNNTLVGMLKRLLPDYKIMIQEDLGYSSDAKEAIAFAILANETINNNYGNITKATGAKERVILGNITLVK